MGDAIAQIGDAVTDGGQLLHDGDMEPDPWWPRLSYNPFDIIDRVGGRLLHSQTANRTTKSDRFVRKEQICIDHGPGGARL